MSKPQLQTYEATIDGIVHYFQLSEREAQRRGLVGKRAGEPEVTTPAVSIDGAEVTLTTSEDGGSVELTVEASPAEDDAPVGAHAKARAPRNKAAKTVETK